MVRLGWLTYDGDPAPIRQRLQALVSQQVAHSERPRGEFQTIYLYLTKGCNLVCQHCYIEGVGSGHDKDFDFPTIKRVIEQALPYGLKKVKVSGGEPFVRQDIFEILIYLDAQGLEIVLETNGTLFQSDTIQQLQSFSNLTVFISLDHLDEKQHDNIRGVPGSYRKTVTMLRELGRKDIQSVVTTVANYYNYNCVVELIDTVLDWGIKRHRTLLNIHPLGNARKHSDLAITIEEAEELIGMLLGSPHFRSGRAYTTLPPALMPLDMLRGIYTCGWGNDIIGILSNGDVSMCSASYDDPDMIGGNVFEQDLIEIWENSVFFKRLREVGEGRVRGVCGNCVFYVVCRGVCRFSSYAHYSEINAPYPFCQEVYNRGGFPQYALMDPKKDCRYGGEVIKVSRTTGATRSTKPARFRSVME